jgi:hypothetical protein
MEKSTFRCSCCDDLKNKPDIIFVKFYEEGHDDVTVGICLECNKKMNDLNIKTVETMIKKIALGEVPYGQ